MSISGNWDHRRVEAVSRMGEIDRRTFMKLGGTDLRLRTVHAKDLG